MEPKAYDLNVLMEALKVEGLELTEAAAKLVVEKTLGWVEASAKISANPWDDLIINFIPQIKAYVLTQADKIDGQVG